MITKKTKKTNPTTTTKKGYDLSNIKTKKAKTAPKKNGALHGFFSLMGFVIGVGSIMAIFVPLVAHANQGVYIVEPFSCDVALADYTELQRVLEVTPRTNWKYEIFLDEYETVVKVLEAHAECEVK